MTQQLVLDLLPAAPPSLDNFVEGDNAAALDALRHCERGRSIYLWGAPGSGRTHLLQALGNQPNAIYVNAPQAAHQIKEMALSNTSPAPLIAVDNVDQLLEQGQAALFALYNRWRESASATQAFSLITAGQQSPLASTLREDLRSRLGWDLVFRLNLLSDTNRVHALETRAAERGLTLSPEVLHWIFTHYERDMRKLSALLDALDHYSVQQHRAITLPLLKDLLANTESLTIHAL